MRKGREETHGANVTTVPAWDIEELVFAGIWKHRCHGLESVVEWVSIQFRLFKIGLGCDREVTRQEVQRRTGHDPGFGVQPMLWFLALAEFTQQAVALETTRNNSERGTVEKQRLSHETTKRRGGHLR